MRAVGQELVLGAGGGSHQYFRSRVDEKFYAISISGAGGFFAEVSFREANGALQKVLQREPQGSFSIGQRTLLRWRYFTAIQPDQAAIPGGIVLFISTS